MDLSGWRILVTGGTGSLGGMLVRELMRGSFGHPAEVRVFSRDEDKQYTMRLNYNRFASYANGSAVSSCDHPMLRFVVGDVRDYASVVAALRDVDVVFHTAALKQVPSCEYAPRQAIMTNALGAMNIARAVSEHARQVRLVVGVSTDKACEPINVMGMTKALQERILIQGNLQCRDTRFICVRYGNVIASRGSVIPVFVRQIQDGGPISITTPEMTRFLISIEDAVETIIDAAQKALPGETYIPKLPAARVVDIAQVLQGDRDIPIVYIGVRPGEKIHEVLVSGEERFRTIERGGYYVIRPIVPELRTEQSIQPALSEPFSSRDVTCEIPQLRELLRNWIPRTDVSAPAAVVAGQVLQLNGHNR